jgi:hypothetical protein
VSAPVVFTLLLAVVVVVLLALMGCGGAGFGESPYQGAGLYVWERKGQQAGRLVFEYCFQAAERERKAFWGGVETAAGRVQLTIACPP